MFKQHITKEQFMELSDEQKGKLWDFANPKKYLVASDDRQTIYPLLSIGQMIEFLGINIIYLENEANWWGIKTTEDLQDIEPVPELCDALWEAVKEVLEK